MPGKQHGYAVQHATYPAWCVRSSAAWHVDYSPLTTPLVVPTQRKWCLPRYCPRALISAAIAASPSLAVVPRRSIW